MLKQCAAFVFLLIATPLLIAQTAPPGAKLRAAPAQSAADWQRKHDIALKYHSLEDFYSALKRDTANKAKAPLPDWSGIWTADKLDTFGTGCLGGSQCYFRPGPGGVAPKLTPVALAELKEGAARDAKGLIYDDNLSTCGPAGFPRWLTEPFLREQIVTPNETWVLTEQMNEIHRIYTDGRATRRRPTGIRCRKGTRSVSGMDRS